MRVTQKLTLGAPGQASIRGAERNRQDAFGVADQHYGWHVASNRFIDLPDSECA